MREPVDVDDQEVIQGLWMGSNRQRVYKGQFEAVLTIGPQGGVLLEAGVPHRHADRLLNSLHQDDLANWVERHWFEGRKTLVRAEPLVDGSRIISRVLLSLGSTDDEALSLLLPIHIKNGNAS